MDKCKILTRLRRIYLLIRAIPKTVYFNMKYLPLSQAIKMPVLVSHRMWIMNLGGQVTVDNKEIKPFMIRLGFNEVGIFDQMRSRGVWNVNGKVIFKGKAAIGHGSKISVESKGELEFGENTIITAESSIICRKNIVIKSDVMISWEVQIMDTDLHAIIDKQGDIINEDEKVEIGHGVWIGSRAMILKGVILKRGVIVAASTVISKSSNKIMKECSLVGGNPVKILKEDVTFKA
ncbi:MAG: acyltransferase [Clostridium sp.]